jgi:hypothetical protein
MNYIIDKIISILDYIITIDERHPRLIYFILGFLIAYFASK